ncbi:MAG: hypothetical protein JST82_07195 [Bacteroidetes bacterium]|nr:hypothetical protein [Bacteroidota bacterium]
MKKTSFVFALLALFAISCSKKDNSTTTTPTTTTSSNSIGGDGNLSTNVVGYNYTCTSDISGVSASSVSVTSHDGSGLVTIRIKAKVPTSGSTLANLIPSSYKDASGNVDVSGKYKNTSEGILDYTNSDSAPFVVVNYNSNVGDKYVLNKSNGQTITRTVTYKSETDDYAYGLMYIKVMKVEQDSRISGIKKIEYIANHKYGLVAIVFYMEDGTTKKVSIY